MATKKAPKPAKKVKTLRPRTLSSNTEKSVKGGTPPTRHPSKVYVPDLS